MLLFVLLRNQKRDILGGAHTLWDRGAAVPNISLHAITTHGQGCGPYEANGAFVGYKTPTDNTQPSTVAAVQSHRQRELLNGLHSFVSEAVEPAPANLEHYWWTWTSAHVVGCLKSGDMNFCSEKLSRKLPLWIFFDGEDFLYDCNARCVLCIYFIIPLSRCEICRILVKVYIKYRLLRTKVFHYMT